MSNEARPSTALALGQLPQSSAEAGRLQVRTQTHPYIAYGISHLLCLEVHVFVYGSAYVWGRLQC
jgi:hypothetical protein